MVTRNRGGVAYFSAKEVQATSAKMNLGISSAAAVVMAATYNVYESMEKQAIRLNVCYGE